jgi:hypothetical protein
MKPVDGNPRAIFTRSQRSIEYHSVLDNHRRSEAYARKVGRWMATNLKRLEREELAFEETFMSSMAVAYKVQPNHVELFTKVVQRLVKV